MAATLLLAACGGGGGSDAGPAPTSVSLSKATAQFHSYVDETDSPAPVVVTASFAGDGLVVGYPTAADQVDWLTVEELARSTTSATFNLRASRGYVPEGQHTTKLRFATGRADGSDIKYVDLPITYVVDDAFRLSGSAVSLDAYQDGRSTVQEVRVKGDLNGWTAASATPWARVLTPAGVAGDVVRIQADAAGLALGAAAPGTVTVTNSDTGQSLPVTVQLHVSPSRTTVSLPGVGLRMYADNALPSATVVVSDAAHAGKAWTASSDSSWLTVTPSGAGGGTLTLAANSGALALATGAQHFASVTVAASGMPAATVRVGLYRSAAANPGTREISVTPVVTNVYPLQEQMALDPVRPLAYLTSFSDHIRVLNLVTGTFGTPLQIGGARFAVAPVVSPDGRRLYAVNDLAPDSFDAQNRPFRTIQVFDLESGTTAGTLRVLYSHVFRLLTAGGRDLLITNLGEIVDTTTGARLREPDESNYYLVNQAYHYISVPALGGAYYFFHESNGGYPACNQIVRRALVARSDGTVRTGLRQFIGVLDGTQQCTSMTSAALPEALD